MVITGGTKKKSLTKNYFNLFHLVFLLEPQNKYATKMFALITFVQIASAVLALRNLNFKNQHRNLLTFVNCTFSSDIFILNNVERLFCFISFQSSLNDFCIHWRLNICFLLLIIFFLFFGDICIEAVYCPFRSIWQQTIWRIRNCFSFTVFLCAPKRNNILMHFSYFVHFSFERAKRAHKQKIEHKENKCEKNVS